MFSQQGGGGAKPSETSSLSKISQKSGPEEEKKKTAEIFKSWLQESVTEEGKHTDGGLALTAKRHCDPAQSAVTYFLHSGSLSSAARHPPQSGLTECTVKSLWAQQHPGASFPLFTP